MLRWLTSGESHGPALAGILEGLPAGVEVTTADIQAALARRRLGYGRGARMTFETDEVRILAGVRHGLTQGGPVAIEIGNSEWPKWVDVMSADPVDDPAALERARNAPLTRPRPGHADLVGMRKYGFDDARPVLERASARETATRVALGTLAARFLEQATGIRLVSHVVAIGCVGVPGGGVPPAPPLGLPRGGPLEDRARVVEAVLAHADKICVSRPGTGQWGVPGPLERGRVVHRVGGHHVHPLGPLAVADLDRDRAALRHAVPDARQDAHLVGLEGHPGPAAVAEPPPGERGLHVGRCDLDAGRHPFQDAHQCRPVRLT